MQILLPDLLPAGLVASSRLGLPWSLASHPCSVSMAVRSVRASTKRRSMPSRMNSLPAPLLSLAHVTVMRGDCAALQDMNLEIACGKHVCILGPNGCGKSTLIKTITRECYPLAWEGSRISILGRERWDIFELRSQLGIVSPDLLASCTTDATGRDV